MTQVAPSKHILTSIVNILESAFRENQDQATSSLVTSASPLPLPSSTSRFASLTGPSQSRAQNALVTLHFLFPHELLPALDLIDRRLVTGMYVAEDNQNTANITLNNSITGAIAGITIPQSEQARTPSWQIKVWYVQSASSSTSSMNMNMNTNTPEIYQTGGLRTAGESEKNARGQGRFRNAFARPGQFYEVRLDTWNCSCPAFALSTLKQLMRGDLTSTSTRAPTGREKAHRKRTRSENSEGRDGGHQGILTRRTVQRLNPAGKGGAYDNDVKDTGTVEWLIGGVATKKDAVIPICKHILAVALVEGAPGFFGSGGTRIPISREEWAGWAAGWRDH